MPERLAYLWQMDIPDVDVVKYQARKSLWKMAGYFLSFAVGGLVALLLKVC